MSRLRRVLRAWWLHWTRGYQERRLARMEDLARRAIEKAEHGVIMLDDLPRSTADLQLELEIDKLKPRPAWQQANPFAAGLGAGHLQLQQALQREAMQNMAQLHGEWARQMQQQQQNMAGLGPLGAALGALGMGAQQAPRGHLRRQGDRCPTCGAPPGQPCLYR